MAISYKRLWKLLIDRDLKKKDLLRKERKRKYRDYRKNMSCASMRLFRHYGINER